MIASVLVGASSVTYPHTTASFSVAQNALVLVVVATTGGAAATATGSTDDISDTFATLGTWSLIQQSNTGLSGKTALYVFHAIAGASESGTVTVAVPTGGSPANAQVSVIQVTDVDLDTPIAGTISEASAFTNYSLTLTEAPLAADVVLGISVSRNDSDGVTPGSGFTELVDFYAGANPSASSFVEWKTSSTSTTVDMTGLDNVHNSVMGLIVKAPNGTAPPPEIWNTYVWDGTNLLPADVFVWDGTTLQPADVFGEAT